MKKSTQITGLPIISISQGHEIGNVKSLVINPEKGSVDFLTVEHDDWQVSVKAIPFRKVVGIGEYAVTVEGDNAVIDLNEIPIANELVNKKIKIIDTKVMTRKGELLGKATEYYVDRENGQIVAMNVFIHEKEAVLTNDFILTYGKDIIVVKEDAVLGLLNSIDELTTSESDELQGREELIATAEIAAAENPEEQALKEKQIDMLVDREVSKDIFDKDGNLFVSSGTVLTKDHVIQAQQKGFDLIIQLSMNIEV